MTMVQAIQRLILVKLFTFCLHRLFKRPVAVIDVVVLERLTDYVQQHIENQGNRRQIPRHSQISQAQIDELEKLYKRGPMN